MYFQARIVNILIFCFLLTSSFAFSMGNKNYLLSFQGSGSHWIMYAIEKITDSPNTFIRHDYNFKDAMEEVNKNPKRIPRSHHVKLDEVKNVAKDDVYLIFVLRNFKECMLHRFNNKKHINNPNVVKSFYPFFIEKSYFVNLEVFDNWNDEKKILLYYEDLLLNPKKFFIDLAKFLKKDPIFIESFMKNYQWYKENSLKNYPGTARSKGSSIKYHSNRKPKHLLYKVDDYIKNQYKDLWNKYLYKYSER